MACQNLSAGWRSSVLHRLEALLKNKEESDLLFKLRTSSKTEKEIYAHKLLFKIGSPVFKVLLSGDWAEKNVVELFDDEFAAFEIMMRYFYTDDIILYSIETASSVYKLADKYDVEYLKIRCLNYLSSEMSSANVCYILEFSELYDKAELRNECINLIIKQTSDVIITKDFLESNKIVLNAIVTQRELAISELDLFKSIHSWAYYNSKQNGIPIETYAISLADIINNIRFLTMKPIEFVEGPGSSFLLSAEEQLNLLKNIVKPGSRLLLERFCTSREYRR